MARDKLDNHGSSKKGSSTPLSEKKSHKRKRDQDGAAAVSSTPTPSKKSKKAESPSSTPTATKEKPKRKRKSEASATGSDQEESASKESAVPSRSGKTSSSSKDGDNAEGKKKSKKSKRKSAGDNGDPPTKDANLVEMEDVDDKEEEAHEKSDVESPSKPAKNKFSGILSKFERSAKVKKAKKTTEDDKDETEAGGMTAEPVIAQGLEPLPQPEVAPEEIEKPTYSSLPPWLANPLRTSADERTKFSDLGIESNLLRILEDNGYKDAFAVQSTVIPLLLPGPKTHSGDLCISAATGSGKTLSYVLPMVTDLKPMPAPRLRGVIVVPTRELVKQAREACELCAAGSGLRVASAVGNVAIKDEQRSLMRIDQAYGPEAFKKRQSFKLVDEDWTNFSLQDCIAEVDDESESLPGYIHKTEPNVDILICTPGRLVDHLRYTKGFTLKHLEWLVIDEADRLLNESFQEWVDVVMNSLDARKAADSFGFSGTFLSELGLPIQSKEPKKVILSATMTRDISKLNTLRLSNPQLVIVGSAEQGAAGEDGEEMLYDNSDEQFTLPPTLKEFSIPVGDGAKKPLHLLKLLRSHVKVDANKNTKPVLSDDTSSSGDSSSEDSSSDDSDSDDTSSDGSSSDSDSESDDDTSSSGSDSDSSESSSDSDSSSESEDEVPEKKKRGPVRTTVLIFTKSSESASRLSRLLSLLDPSLATTIGTIIKSNKSSASRKTLTAYRQGKISIIIATDRASRGLDLPSLSHVVNYDVPSSITTYVHRVGRTARAGKEGSAWTLVAHREGRWFEKEIAKGSDGKITRLVKVDRVNVKLEDMEDAKSRYGRALEELENEVKAGSVVKSAKPEA
ncbi:P-loop containing nucleoside triphosphate hydrolase protein [Aspergillus steynii IBT 23096]|uniref:ATP-dependent RNA helicase n=1 Tax=Aspergillus steynii IBT 23096 TaxID=1392250 RepID=A0A2I2FVB7_9EURO|nr:P-loop containing nucleoside triphosphate hydrolase protein [Aspergillus steynii IBT 23096]PLB44547.1 P-loop containing nucleoside triphosphate hydrolase protein [Aspergillus steynii IBT 23096]